MALEPYFMPLPNEFSNGLEISNILLKNLDAKLFFLTAVLSPPHLYHRYMIKRYDFGHAIGVILTKFLHHVKDH
jgi:hypothetical protein